MAGNFPTSLPAFTTKNDGPGNPINAAHINLLQDEVIELGRDFISGLRRPLRLEDATEFTIASGAITITRGYGRIDTEADAAADDLTTITPGANVGAGSVLLLRAENTARVVTLKDGGGNLLLHGGDAVLDATDKVALLVYDGTSWRGGLIGAAASTPPVGSIVQTVTATYATATNSSSSSFADTGLTATITPQSASNKVLVTVFQNGIRKVNNTYLALKLKRGSTDLITFAAQAGYTADSAEANPNGAGCVYLDSPASASAVTYKTQFASVSNIASVGVQSTSSVSTICLQEIQQ